MKFETKNAISKEYAITFAHIEHRDWSVGHREDIELEWGTTIRRTVEVVYINVDADLIILKISDRGLCPIVLMLEAPREAEQYLQLGLSADFGFGSDFYVDMGTIGTTCLDANGHLLDSCGVHGVDSGGGCFRATGTPCLLGMTVGTSLQQDQCRTGLLFCPALSFEMF